MADLTRKLGIRAGDVICLLGAPPEAESAIRENAPPGVQFSTELFGKRYQAVFFWPTELPGLVARFAELQGRIHPDGAVWAVLPKKPYAARRGIAFTWEQMQAAGLSTDLVDNKVASVTEQDYATRFVIRKERRMSYYKST